jgi:hypothetical protein
MRIQNSTISALSPKPQSDKIRHLNLPLQLAPHQNPTKPHTQTLIFKWPYPATKRRRKTNPLIPIAQRPSSNVSKCPTMSQLIGVASTSLPFNLPISPPPHTPITLAFLLTAPCLIADTSGIQSLAVVFAGLSGRRLTRAANPRRGAGHDGPADRRRHV